MIVLRQQPEGSVSSGGQGRKREGDVGQPGVIEPSAKAQKDDCGSRQQEEIGKGGRDFAAAA